MMYPTKVLLILSALMTSIGAFTPTSTTTKKTILQSIPNHSSEDQNNNNSNNDIITRRSIFQKTTVSTASIALSTIISSLITTPQPSNARLDPVDNPSLLPTTPNEVVIQTEKFLTSGQVKRMTDLIVNLEKDTGFRLRVLCQNYPNTPGLAIRDYWDLGKDVSVSITFYI